MQAALAPTHAAELDARDARVAEQVEAAVEIARAEPAPDPSDLLTDVYATEIAR